jgi:hypothetical protein
MKIALFGDTVFGGDYLDYCKIRNIEPVRQFKYIADKLSAHADAALVNLEGSIADGPENLSGTSTILRNDKQIIDVFGSFKKVIFNIANNHILDYGEQGFRQTVETFSHFDNIYTVGAGSDIEDANKLLSIDIGGRNVGFLSFTSPERHIGAVIAGKESSGCASYIDEDAILESIRLGSGETDVLIVSMHWGIEYYEYPQVHIACLAERIIDAGATMIVGHHPHVIQGMQKIGNGIVFYSLGNFFLPAIQMYNGRKIPRLRKAREFVVPIVEVVNPQDIAVVRCYFGYHSPKYAITLFREGCGNHVEKRMNILSEPLQRSNYQEFYAKYEKNRSRMLIFDTIYLSFLKLFSSSLPVILNTFKFNDVVRVFARLAKLVGAGRT